MTNAVAHLPAKPAGDGWTIASMLMLGAYACGTKAELWRFLQEPTNANTRAPLKRHWPDYADFTRRAIQLYSDWLAAREAQATPEAAAQ